MAPVGPRKPDDGSLWLTSCFCRRKRRRSSRASISSLSEPWSRHWSKAHGERCGGGEAVRQALLASPSGMRFRPRPRAMWDLPVPLGPRASCRIHASGMMTVSRRRVRSQRASSSTCILSSSGIALKSKLSVARNWFACKPIEGGSWWPGTSPP